jgi:hypothetical protein
MAKEFAREDEVELRDLQRKRDQLVEVSLPDCLPPAGVTHLLAVMLCLVLFAGPTDQVLVVD